MYKFISATIVLLAGLVALVACQSEEEVLTPSQAEETELEYVYLGDVKITPISHSRSEGDNVFTVIFQDDEEISPLNLTLTQNGSEYGCDINGSGDTAFFIKVMDSEKGVYQYLNKNKEPLQEFSLTENKESHEFTLEVIKLFDNPTLMASSRAKSLSDCFSRRMGSTTGILLTITTAFLGPEGPAAVAAGAALSCAIWTPY